MSPAVRPSLSLWARDVVGDLKSAPDTFSSWDKCMAKSYCKWPVIVGIIIGAVIVISVIACIVNCMCCGIQCCTGCCRCCSCCCPSPRNKAPRAKYLDDPGYHQPPPMPANGIYQYQPPPAPPPAPPAYHGPQVARFDSPASPSPPDAKVNEDSLPAMPSWSDAVTKRVEDTAHHDTMEMEPLNPTRQDYHRAPSPGRFNGPGQTGVPPIRTGTSSPAYFPASSPYDDQRQYDHGPSGTYNQPYDYSQGNLPQPMPRNPSPYTPQPHYSPMPTAFSPPSDLPHYIPYGQSSSLSATNPVPLEANDRGRPPSLLQSGRKPIPNSYRDV